MKKLFRKWGAGSIAVTIALTNASGIGYANNYADEMLNASQAAGKMNTHSQQQMIAGLQPTISQMDLSNMDLETALMAVQTQRTQLLDEQLQSQIKEVQQRNRQIADLNKQISSAQAELAKLKDSDSDEIRALEIIIQQLKSQIDSISNSQQMDMLRLQSLSNKRNEAFDVMTDFIKKMQENRKSIIGNMR